MVRVRVHGPLQVVQQMICQWSVAGSVSVLVHGLSLKVRGPWSMICLRWFVVYTSVWSVSSGPWSVSGGPWSVSGGP